MIVFVHGVPETADIWRKVQAGTSRPSTAVSLPGFGNPRPDGFAATKDAYVDWLVDTLIGIRQPIDLVGHDWGAGITFGLLQRRLADAPLRSWAVDCGSLLHPEYVWHQFAQIWQTPGAGEESLAAQREQPVEERAGLFAGIFGLDEADALEMMGAGDVVMDSCILDLYRSATPNPHADWGPIVPMPVPGMVIHPTEDMFSIGPQAEEVAGALGARFATLDGANHFWPYSDAAAALELLEGFWSSVD
jgi:pimeloyl-ACP methyl ester carboxylesterase